MGKREKKDKKKKRRKDKERKQKREKKPVEEVAEPVSDEDESGAESPSQLLLKRAKGSDSGSIEPRRKRKRSSSKSSRSRSSSRSKSRSRSLSAQSSSFSRSPSPDDAKRRDRDRLTNDEKKKVEALRKRVYQRDPKENGSSSGSSKKKRRNRNRYFESGKRGKFDRSRKVWGLDDDIEAGGRSRSVSSERRGRRRERNRSGSSEGSRSPNGKKPEYLDEVRDENGRIDKKKVLEIARRNASLGQLDSLINVGALAPEIAKLKSQNADNILNYVQKLREIPDEVPPASTSAPPPPVEPTPISSDEEEKEERFKRMTEKRRAAMKGHEDDEMSIVARKPFEVKKPLLGISGIKINIANANALPTKTAQERIQEEAKLRAAQVPVPSNPLHEWIPVVKEKEPQPTKKKEAAAAPAIADVFGAAFLPPPPVPPSIDMLLPPPPVPPSFEFGGTPAAAESAPFLPPPPLPPSEIDM
ncbi:hypothetical protein QR680_008857 [Steinernema hermaphroditum]|uniref:Uncharacterized protein n=1 Tax=Steinernema hermaphroditum TaxID=289476 RepID=A0AA39II74_9BILA|nr:hypothetical protein QR680_008857 [Steinernema hermaphroditum]